MLIPIKMESQKLLYKCLGCINVIKYETNKQFVQETQL